MGRILDLFGKLERKLDKPADTDLLLDDDRGSESITDEELTEEQRRERAAKVRKQRQAKAMRWGGGD